MCVGLTAIKIRRGFFFFFNDAATTEIYTLSLHDALPILPWTGTRLAGCTATDIRQLQVVRAWRPAGRSEEHMSELQSHLNLGCRLLLEKKNLYKQVNLKRTQGSLDFISLYVQ